MRYERWGDFELSIAHTHFVVLRASVACRDSRYTTYHAVSSIWVSGR